MAEGAKPLRTAVLVVHGMGNQRPLETMRGLTAAVWLKNRSPGGEQGRYWIHPDRLNGQLDLAVLTTEASPSGGERRVDFHELYWAHLMSETRPVAVLLWLFELVKKGPSAKWKALRGAWWAGSLFLILCLLSAVHLPLALLAHIGVKLAEGPGVGTAVVIIALLVVGLIGVAARAGGLALVALIVAAPAAVASLSAGGIGQLHEYLPILIVPCLGVVLAYASMGRRGLLLTAIVVLASQIMWVVATCGGALPSCAPLWHWGGRTDFVLPQLQMPWSTRWREGIWLSTTFLALYAAFNALFLQTVLGDAARYLRDSPANVAARRAIRQLAVDTLQGLHQSGDYDRIVIIAHSLGTIVAYDMLRAYWARVHGRIPVTGAIADAVADVQAFTDEAMRKAWRETPSAAGMEAVPEARGSSLAKHRAQLDKLRRKLQLAIADWYRLEGSRRWNEERAEVLPPDEPGPPPVWLATDFVTLGSPLTHAPYLLCEGASPGELAAHFGKRKDERELPTAPPRLDLEGRDQEGTLTFRQGERTRFHHSALFGLTRWSNLYFSGKWWAPFSLGDPIGGALMPGFGWAIHDFDVAEGPHARPRLLFEHTSYWVGEPSAGHIQALIAAVDLPDVLATRIASS